MVVRPTPERLARASRELNILRSNHRNVLAAHDMDHRNLKKYVPDLSETLEMIIKLFQESFGTTNADLCRETDFSKLAHAKIDENDIGWQVMLKSRPELRKWVAEAKKKEKLWAVPDSFRDPTDDDESDSDDGSDDGDVDSGGSSDDWDVPLHKLQSRAKLTRTKFWLQSMKPLRQESEDDYSDRVMFLLQRGIKDQGKLRSQRQRQEAAAVEPPSAEDIVQAGKEARLFYLELRPDRKELKPTKVLEHNDAGPKKGRQYLLQWKYPGCGPGKTKWVGPDHMAIYPDLLENYNKVTPYPPSLCSQCSLYCGSLPVSFCVVECRKTKGLALS